MLRPSQPADLTTKTYAQVKKGFQFPQDSVQWGRLAAMHSATAGENPAQHVTTNTNCQFDGGGVTMWDCFAATGTLLSCTRAYCGIKREPVCLTAEARLSLGHAAGQ